MSYSDPTKLGILACPGADAFANQVIRRLAGIYKRRFDRKTEALAYALPYSQELVTQKINFDNDIQSSLLYIPGQRESLRPPRFKVMRGIPISPTGRSRPRSSIRSGARICTSSRISRTISL